MNIIKDTKQDRNRERHIIECSYSLRFINFFINISVGILTIILIIKMFKEVL